MTDQFEYFPICISAARKSPSPHGVANVPTFVAPGCVLPLAVPDESLEAVVKGVKGAQQ